MVNERIAALRNKMREKSIDFYIVPTNDYHSSEYVGEYFKTREYISGFTGSAGTVVITMDRAILWTDGRYFIQAQNQIENSEIELYKAGNEGVPTVADFVKNEITVGKVVGFDGRCVDAGFYEKLSDIVKMKNAYIEGKYDLVGEIWKDRPELSSNEVFELDIKYAGEERNSKLKKVWDKVEKTGADFFVLSSLDDIAWMFNLRGSDIKCNPVFLSYVIMNKEKTRLFTLPGAINEELKSKLKLDNVEILEYFSFYDVLKSINDSEQKNKKLKILLDRDVVNSAIIKELEKCVIIDEVNPTLILKAVKNSTEVENERKAHVKDGIAVTKFIYWLKKNTGKLKITEVSAADYLEKLRMMGEHYMGQSFEPIVAYGKNGAMCHYSPKEEDCATLKEAGFVLFDTGGQYLEGTTDVTRTVALGPLTDEEKLHYTLVLKGNLKLGAAKFLYGIKGANLDYIARESLWEHGLDYNHGTGHGVGYFLNVHEGPNNIRYRICNNKCPENDILQEGMITSNEPGLYLEGRYGIRLENMIVCKKKEKTEYGQFMGFETLTLVPFDIEAIDEKQLSEREKTILNMYHKEVYEKLEQFLDEDERAWLREATKEI